jgi:8-oxo-dGTP diphosphatase
LNLASPNVFSRSFLQVSEVIDVETPKLTVDAVIVDSGRVVLIRRVNPPFKDCWALPGGFVEVGETVEAACVREAREETSLDVEIVRLIGVFSDPKRDPRGHTASAAYICRVGGGLLKGADDAKEARWFALEKLPKLAFDHALIMESAKALL